ACGRWLFRLAARDARHVATARGAAAVQDDLTLPGQSAPTRARPRHARWTALRSLRFRDQTGRVLARRGTDACGCRPPGRLRLAGRSASLPRSRAAGESQPYVRAPWPPAADSSEIRFDVWNHR